MNKTSTFLRVKWIWLSGFLLINLVFTQDIDFGFPGNDNPVSDEDLIIMESLMTPTFSAAELVNQIKQLSFLTSEDIQYLGQYGVGLTNELVHGEHSPNLVELLKYLKVNSIAYSLAFNQNLVFKQDVRYRWRIQWDFHRFKSGVTVERDPLEPNMADFISAYTQISKGEKRIILGNYQVFSGYGLVLGKSFGLVKGFETIKYNFRVRTELRPFRSSIESWSFYGFGYAGNSGIFSIGLTPCDGRIDTTGTVLVKQSGIHTSERAQAEKGRLRELSMMSAYQWEKSKFKFGYTTALQKWKDGKLSTLPQITGSLFFNQAWDNVHIFGEIARGDNLSMGIISGIKFFHPGIKYGIISRKYSQGFSAIRSNPFSEWSGQKKNEQGIFQGLNLKSGRNHIMIYSDLFSGFTSKKAWLPLYGEEMGCRYEWIKAKNHFRFQWVQKQKTVNKDPFSPDTSFIPIDKKITLKGMIRTQLTEKIRGKFQVNKTTIYNNTKIGKGYGMYGYGEWAEANYKVAVDGISTWAIGSSPSLYFWDMNLPNEMKSIQFSKPSYSWAIKWIWIPTPKFQLGLRFRSSRLKNNSDLPFHTEGALFVRFYH